MQDLSLKQFIEAVASLEPVPGGGSVSALCGAFASALGTMVARLTIGRKKYADVQSMMEEIAEKLAPASALMLNSVKLDADAYAVVFEAYKLPKETDEDKAARKEAIQTALRHAANVPFSVARLAATFLPSLIDAATYGNQNAITDAYVATLCARTAIMGACANANINLASIDDEAFVTDMKRDIVVLRQQADEAERKVTELLNKSLS